LIAVSESAPKKAESKARIFVSYSRRDMAFVDRLEATLKARGYQTLIDRQEIYAFEDWWGRIEALIVKADTIIFVLSPEAIASDVCAKEVAFASSLNKRFAPIVCRRVDDSAVPAALRRLNFIFFDDAAQYEASADKLAEALETDIGWIRRHTEFGETARRWHEGERAGGMLLRPPLLDQAEAWLAFRPSGAPAPTEETEAFIAASRKAEVAGRRRNRILNAALYTMLIGIILGLVGWIKQAYIKEQWNWYTVMLPYAVANFHPYVLTMTAERSLKPSASFRECSGKAPTSALKLRAARKRPRVDCPEMIVIPSGSFLMGSSQAEQSRFNSIPKGANDNDLQNHDTDRLANEGPQHKVVIAQSFAVSKFDVTFDEWDACVSVGGCRQRNDGGMGRGNKPAITVSWDDAQQYVTWLSNMTRRSYRLLTEAEWEFAARAGTTTTYYWGGETGEGNANCTGCDSEAINQTSPVGSFPANPFGLYDMAGNVWQWVQDCYSRNYNQAPTDGSASDGQDCVYRVARGGSWNIGPEYARSAVRFRFPSTYQAINRGFRVARTLNQ
jgi:formylglycine-generating enzyme required for sulfatase activity